TIAGAATFAASGRVSSLSSGVPDECGMVPPLDPPAIATNGAAFFNALLAELKGREPAVPFVEGGNVISNPGSRTTRGPRTIFSTSFDLHLKRNPMEEPGITGEFGLIDWIRRRQPPRSGSSWTQL